MGRFRIVRRWKYLAVLLIAGAPMVSAAGVEAGPPQEVVRIGDLNLTEAHGVAAAYNRLLWAANRVCAGTDSADYWVRESAVPCVMRAVRGGIERIGSRRLAEYARGQQLFRLRHAEVDAQRADGADHRNNRES